jgi:hypothetical protein
MRQQSWTKVDPRVVRSCGGRVLRNLIDGTGFLISAPRR